MNEDRLVCRIEVQYLILPAGLDLGKPSPEQLRHALATMAMIEDLAFTTPPAPPVTAPAPPGRYFGGVIIDPKS